jgi:hypothetical protein
VLPHERWHGIAAGQQRRYVHRHHLRDVEQHVVRQHVSAIRQYAYTLTLRHKHKHSTRKSTKRRHRGRKWYRVLSSSSRATRSRHAYSAAKTRICAALKKRLCLLYRFRWLVSVHSSFSYLDTT